MRQLPTTEAQHFDDTQRRQVEVLFEAILPGTDTAPGARDADAAGFLSTLLAVDAATFYEVAAWRELYASALPALDAAAQERLGAPLAELDPGQARQFVSALAGGSLAALPPEIDQRRLFATLRAHCIEGCFSDARWGGNQGGIMWRWLGYPTPPEEFVR